MSMSIKKFATKKVVVIGTAVALTLGIAGGAYAYFTASGTGTGSASTGSSTAMTLLQDTALKAVAPGVGAQTITGHQYNSAGTPEFVTSVTPSITSVTETPAAITAWGDPNFATDSGNANGTSGTYYCTAADYTLTGSTPGAEEASGSSTSTSPTEGTGDFSFGTIAFKDSLTQNQDACEGATLVLGFSSN
ncbi:MAG: hypothetical protein JWM55_1229 [Acidimicrobiaceae bacterium]|nr:hypothetical protein [Acidimicrobiaceae bacterium]